MKNSINIKNSIIYMLIFLFTSLFTISYTNITNNTRLRFILLLSLNIIGIIHIASKNNKSKTNKSFNDCLIILIINMIPSVIFSKFPYESFIKTLSIIDSFILFFYAIPLIIKRLPLKKLVKTILLSMLLVLLYEFIFYHNIYLYDGGARLTTIHQRLILNFIYPSALGWPAFLLCVTSFYLCNDYETSFIKKIIYVLCFTFGMYLLYMCDIRTAIYSLFLYILIYLLCIKIKQFDLLKLNKKIYVAIKMFAITILAIIILAFFTRGIISYYNINMLLSNRLALYKSALMQLINNNIIYGVGAYRNSHSINYGIVQIDNSYLNFTFSYGVSNLIILLYAILYVKSNIKRKMIECDKNNPLNRDLIFVFSIYISFLIYSFFEITLLNISSLLGLIIWPIVMSYIYDKGE